MPTMQIYFLNQRTGWETLVLHPGALDQVMLCRRPDDYQPDMLFYELIFNNQSVCGSHQPILVDGEDRFLRGNVRPLPPRSSQLIRVYPLLLSLPPVKPDPPERRGLTSGDDALKIPACL